MVVGCDMCCSHFQLERTWLVCIDYHSCYPEVEIIHKLLQPKWINYSADTVGKVQRFNKNIKKTIQAAVAEMETGA